LQDVLGEKYDSLVTGATYEIQDLTVDSQIVKLKASGADVLVIAAAPKFAAQTIRKFTRSAGSRWHFCPTSRSG
jgi:branched-chain amino acid transport system substrate-binding protein